MLEKVAATFGLSEEEFGYILEQGIEKIASEQEEYFEKVAEAEFVDAVEKIAHITGLDAEDLAEEILAYRDHLIKEAQIEALVDATSEEQAEELLKEAVAENPKVAAIVAAIEEADEDEELLKIAQLISNLTDEELEGLLSEEDVEENQEENEK